MMGCFYQNNINYTIRLLTVEIVCVRDINEIVYKPVCEISSME